MNGLSGMVTGMGITQKAIRHAGTKAHSEGQGTKGASEFTLVPFSLPSCLGAFVPLCLPPYATSFSSDGMTLSPPPTATEIGLHAGPACPRGEYHEAATHSGAPATTDGPQVISKFVRVESP